MGRPKLSGIDTATTERILAAAEDAFARGGLSATRLEDIATAAGVRRPSLLYHFPSKDALYDATVSRVFGRLRDALLAAMQSEGDFGERLDGTVRNYVQFLADNPNIARLFFRELLDEGGPGRRLIEEQVAPLLARAETFVRESGKDWLRPTVDVRTALLQIVAGAAMYAIAGPLRSALWDEPAGSAKSGDTDRRRSARHAVEVQGLVRAMLLGKPALKPKKKKARSLLEG